MLNRFNTVIVITLLLSSCVSVKKTEAPVVAEVDNKVQLNNFSEHKRWAIEAKAQDFDEGQLMGSANIEVPHKHNKKTYFLYGAEHLKLENNYFDIPVVYNAAVKKWINYFLNRGRGFFERYSARAGRYAPVLSKILDDHGLPQDLIFLAMAESGFQSKAKSWAKAVGPWQFMPYTGKRFGLKIDWYIDERRDPFKATVAASEYLKKLYEEFESWELAAAAYNAGEGKMSRAIRRYRTESFWKIRRGRYLKAETKNYVPKIMALAIIGKNLKSFGFEDIEYHEPLDFEEVKVKGALDLYKVAERIDVDFEELQRLNPEIRRWFTPPNVESYSLRVPVGSKVVWQNCCSDTSELIAADFQSYRVKGKRSKLSDVARKFKIKYSDVLTWLNDGKSKNARLRRGELVTLPFKVGQSKRANMYADLYDKPRKSVIRKRNYRKRIRLAKRRGKKITTPSRYYVVKKGDSLWSVSKKTGTSLDTLIVSNLNIVQRRMIRVGDKLVIR